jgi:hypothetical protein
VSNPARPREVSRRVFADPTTPHWLALDDSAHRLVATSGTGKDPRVHLAVVNAAGAALRPDPVTPMGDLSRVTVPGLGVVRAVPHGGVFGPGGALTRSREARLAAASPRRAR